MSMEKDEHDDKAAELLPCSAVCIHYGGVEHLDSCPGRYRPAVAAALRAASARRPCCEAGSCAELIDLQMKFDTQAEAHKAEIERYQFFDGSIGIARELNTANQISDSLRAQLSDPPPDVQELVIKKLDLVSRDALATAKLDALRAAKEVVTPQAIQRHSENHVTYGNAAREWSDRIQQLIDAEAK